MTLRLITAQDYETYFKRLAQSDFTTSHYLDADADAEMRCVLSPVVKWLCRMLPCFRKIFSTPIETSLTLLHGRIETYGRMDGKGAGFYESIITTTEKINALIDRINAKRGTRGQPLIPEEMRFQTLAYQARWNKTNIVAKARAGDPAARLFLSASLISPPESTSSVSVSSSGTFGGMPLLYGAQLPPSGQLGKPPS